jgi:hypothetical protein
MNSSMLIIFNQNQHLLQENKDLQILVQSTLNEKAAMKTENELLNVKLTNSGLIPKRRYTTRRNWL